MTGHDTPGDAWLSSDEYNTRASANVEVRAETSVWFRQLTPWFAQNRLMVHNGLPVMHGTHWTTDGVWLLATPVDELGTPVTEAREGQAARLGMVWAPSPSAPPERLRRLADWLPAGAPVPGIRTPETNLKLVRAPGWKAGLAKANRALEDRRDWWEHRSLGADAQRKRADTSSSWLDTVRGL